MISHSHLSSEMGTLAAIADASTVHADLTGVPDHQSASSHSFPDFQPDVVPSTLYSSNDAVVPTVAATNPSGWATTQSWARHQPLIKQLYLYEKKPLAEVMRIMERQHGFRATVKMYKTHIKQWGLDKKNKVSEMRAIVRKNKQRADQGKGSIVRVRGQLRDFAEVVRYWNRKGESIDRIIARQTASPTPEAVELSTPTPSPILTPHEFAIPERLFRCIRNYFDGSFESGTWVRTEPTDPCHSIKDGGNTIYYTVAQFASHCRLAGEMFSKGSFQEAGRNLIVATSKINRILSSEYPEALVEILGVIAVFHYEKRDEVALSILRQFSALGTVLLGRQHPLSLICEWINSVYASDLSSLVTRCIESMADQFERFVGPMHISTLGSRLTSIEVAGWEGNSRMRMLQKLLSEYEKILQPHDFRTVWVSQQLASEYFDRSYYVEARTLSQKNIASSQHFQFVGSRESTEIQGLYLLAMCQYALGEVDLGIANLHRVIDTMMLIRGPQDAGARQWLVHLEDFYIQQGRWSSAAQVRDWREKTLESVDID